MNHAYQILFALLSVSAAILFFRRREAVQLAPFDVRRTLPLRGLLALLVMLVMCGCYKVGLRDLSRHALHGAMGPAVALSAYVIRGLPQTAMRLFSFLGRISFEIYLLHFVGERIIRRAGLGPIESLAVVLAVTVPLAFVVHAADAAIVKRLTRRRP